MIMDVSFECVEKEKGPRVTRAFGWIHLYSRMGISRARAIVRASATTSPATRSRAKKSWQGGASHACAHESRAGGALSSGEIGRARKAPFFNRIVQPRARPAIISNQLLQTDFLHLQQRTR
jgi:hypothetical protein